ncbi:MAG: PilW family protein [Bermanella sp.]
MKKQSGFTLIELMIAGFIGLFLFTGLMNLYITTNKSVTLSDSLSQNQEAGRFAMDYLTKFIRRAGYTEDFTAYTPVLFMSPGSINEPITCTGTQVDACAANNPNVAPVNVIGDRLSIAMDIGANPEDLTRSCTGTIVGGPANGVQRIVNVFWVSSEADTARQLRCRTFSRDTNDWLDQPTSIINNIERLEFQVGIASNISDQSASRYVSVDTIEADPNVDMNFVRSIRVSILTTSQNDIEEKVQSTSRKRTYNILDSPVFTIEDTNLRNIFTNTVELPNMIGPAGTGT